MTNASSLYQLVDDLVAKKTFSLDALDSIKEIRDGLVVMTKKLEESERKYKALFDTNSSQSDLLLKQNSDITALKMELADARANIRECEIAIHEKKTAEAVAAAYKDAMEIVFRPSAVRETIQRNVVQPVQGNPGGNGVFPSPGYLAQGQESETITRTNE